MNVASSCSCVWASTSSQEYRSSQRGDHDHDHAKRTKHPDNFPVATVNANEDLEQGPGELNPVRSRPRGENFHCLPEQNEKETCHFENLSDVVTHRNRRRCVPSSVESSASRIQLCFDDLCVAHEESLGPAESVEVVLRSRWGVYDGRVKREQSLRQFIVLFGGEETARVVAVVVAVHDAGILELV
jgi:hypothetical protein